MAMVSADGSNDEMKGQGVPQPHTKEAHLRQVAVVTSRLPKNIKEYSNILTICQTRYSKRNYSCLRIETILPTSFNSTALVSRWEKQMEMSVLITTHCLCLARRQKCLLHTNRVHNP